MTNEQNRIKTLRQTNRLLTMGYLLLGVFVLGGYVLAQTRGPNDDDDADTDDAPSLDDRLFVAVNNTEENKIAAVESERGFAVYIEDDGQINVIHRDGTVIVPNRKIFSNTYQERVFNKDYSIELPVERPAARPDER